MTKDKLVLAEAIDDSVRTPPHPLSRSKAAGRGGDGEIEGDRFAGPVTAEEMKKGMAQLDQLADMVLAGESNEYELKLLGDLLGLPADQDADKQPRPSRRRKGPKRKNGDKGKTRR